MTIADDRNADDRIGRAALSGLVAVLHALRRAGTLDDAEIDSIIVSVLLNFGRSEDPHPGTLLIRDVLRPLARPSALDDAGL
jgi:hypothetical protein